MKKYSATGGSRATKSTTSSEPARSHDPRPWPRRLALASIGLVGALAILELGARIAAVFERNHLDEISSSPPARNGGELSLGEILRPHPNDRIVYELRPNLSGRFLGQELSVNSLGMRAPERTRAKASGTFRIVGLGDSVMFGWGVPEAESYPSIVERELNARFPGRHFEVWNLAVPGYNTVQEVAAFAEKIDRLDPDLVVISWVGNDADLPNFLAARPDPWALDESFLWRLVERRMAGVGHPEPSEGLFEVPMDAKTRRLLLPVEQIPERYRPLVGWDNMVDAFRRLARMVRQRNIPAVALFDSGPRHLKKLCADEGFVIAESQHRVLRYEKEHGVERYTALRLSPSDTHPNALGHQLIAETLLDALVRDGALNPGAGSPDARADLRDRPR